MTLTAEQKVEKARDVLIELWRNNDLDRSDLDEKLADAEMRPYGAGFRRRVMVEFWVGSEDEHDLERFQDNELDMDGWVERYNEDADDVVILNPEDGVDVTFGPILRGNLPS